MCNNYYLADILNKGFNLGDAFSKSLSIYLYIVIFMSQHTSLWRLSHFCNYHLTEKPPICTYPKRPDIQSLILVIFNSQILRMSHDNAISTSIP